MTARLIDDYFRPTVHGFWKWLDDGDGAGWRDGKLIAFNGEIAFVIDQLASEGLPRLGSLLLLLAATAKSWAVDSREADLLTEILRSEAVNETTQDERLAMLQRVLEGLNKVRSLDRTLRRPLEAKAAIAAIVFESQDKFIRSDDARRVAERFHSPMARDLIGAEQANETKSPVVELLKDLACLDKGLRQVSPEIIRLRLETGLDSLPKAAPIEPNSEPPPLTASARNVIDSLLQSPEHAAIAALSKQLLAITSLPRKLIEKHEQELGGYSDITNRGSPDRLLLSELAQDGMTLAVRVAMNEAMYLHREVPPSVPRIHRELLIDSGVRAWGMSRVFAASVALAIAANTPDQTTLQVWRGRGKELVSVDLLTREGFIEHLGAIEADPHLGTALDTLQERVSQSDAPVEVIVLMPNDAYNDPTLVEALRRLSASRVYVATVDSSGEFQLREQGVRGEKTMRRAKFSLDQLVDAPASIQETRDLEHLPAIFRVDPFPLRLPVQIDNASSWSIGNWGALTVTNDGRLMRWAGREKGAMQLSDQLSKGKLWWMGPDCIAGATSFVHGSSNQPTLYDLSIPRRKLTATPLPCSDFRAITAHNGILFAVHDDRVSEIDPKSGQAGHWLQLQADLVWMHGRFFRNRYTDAWFALSHNGHSATLEPLPRFDQSGRMLVYFWDAVGFSEPLALTRNGRITASTGASFTDILGELPNIDWTVDAMNHDGTRLLVASQQSSITRSCQIKLTLDRKVEIHRRRLLDDRVSQLARAESLRKRFLSIGVTLEGNLALRGAKSVLATSRGGGKRILRTLSSGTLLRAEKPFQPSTTSYHAGYNLSIASWPSGDRAVLDSRGLLHIQPSASDGVEVSIVLASGELSGWCNDGQVFGREFFLPDDKTPIRNADAREHVYRRSIESFLEAISVKP